MLLWAAALLLALQSCYWTSAASASINTDMDIVELLQSMQPDGVINNPVVGPLRTGLKTGAAKPLGGRKLPAKRKKSSVVANFSRLPVPGAPEDAGLVPGPQGFHPINADIGHFRGGSQMGRNSMYLQSNLPLYLQ